MLAAETSPELSGSTPGRAAGSLKPTSDPHHRETTAIADAYLRVELYSGWKAAVGKVRAEN